MTVVGESDSSLAAKCLDLCQALAGQGMAFNFSLSIGSTFSFSLDARGRGQALANQGKTKKKKTPSTMQRNARRRTEFLKKKLEDSGEPKGPTCGSAQGTRKEYAGGLFKCDQCEKDFKTENGLKIHVGKTHNKVDSDHATPEVARHQLRSSVSLSASPLLNTSREESPIHHDAVPEHRCPSYQCARDQCPKVTEKQKRHWEQMLEILDKQSEDSS